jgi:hypothetical protein
VKAVLRAITNATKILLFGIAADIGERHYDEGETLSKETIRIRTNGRTAQDRRSQGL